MLAVAAAVAVGWIAGYGSLLGLLLMLALQSSTGRAELWVEV